MKWRRVIITFSVSLVLIVSSVAVLSKSEQYIPQLLRLKERKVAEYKLESFPEINLMYSEPIRIISDENFTDYGFPGYGNYTHPYIIESLHINDTWEGTAIYVQDTTKHFQIRDCYLNTESYGVVIKDVSNGTATIIGNYCQDSAGIYLLNATGSKIINNTVTLKNGYGIQALMSHYLSIENNTCFDLSFNGIDLYQCNYTSVIGNNCSWNERSGMKIDNSFYTEISKNILLANKEDSGWSCGIYINSCEFTVFSENFFEDNDDGLRIYDCREILVHNNSFRNNEYSYDIMLFLLTRIHIKI